MCKDILTTITYIVPSKVRVIDNQPSLNISNVGFPDLEYISSHELQAISDEKESTDMADTSDELPAMSTSHSKNLQGISEDTEEFNEPSDVNTEPKISINKSDKPHHIGNKNR